ncbi:LacI family DNA-binding transcriptional regulator [soil metagenome]
MSTIKSQLRREATLKDVARLAGVSTATVARVLHNRGYVAEETRSAVTSAIAETGYRVNAVAQGLRKQRTFLIGHVLQAIAPNPFFATVALASQQEAARHGCGLILSTSQANPNIERDVVETLLRQRVDAILFTTVTSEENVALAVAAGIPVVQVERVGEVESHGVSVDNFTGAFDAVAHLIKLGHRRIAFIGVSPETPHGVSNDGRVISYSFERRSVERERLGGYSAALAANDIAMDPQLIELGSTYYSSERGNAVTKRLMDLDPEVRPTAILAACDLLAAGVLQELTSRGLRVPEDISVVGSDDTYASHLSPPLTSVAQPMIELGTVAIRMAIDALDGESPNGEVFRKRLSAKLVIRVSTGPPPVDSSPTW